MLRRLVTGDGGFGLLELLIAMTVMTIGIMAIVAGFSSGLIALNSASRASTAGVLADKQMEAYRALPYTKIALKASLVSAAASPYTTDTSYQSTSLTDTLLASTTDAYDGSYCSSSPATCQPVQSSVTGADGRTYRVDSYIAWYCAAGRCGPPPTTAARSRPPCRAAPTARHRPSSRRGR